MASNGVMPSRMALTTFKAKKVAASKGYDLLKKKSDALTVRFRAMLRDIYETKLKTGDTMKDASFSLAEAVWAAGDFKRKVIDDAASGTKAAIVLEMRQDNVAGVKLPIFHEHKVDSGSPEKKNAYGLSGGGKAIANSKEQWRILLSALIKLASLQTSFMALDEAIKITNRRVNALDSVVIPMIVETIAYIESELDELEREDIFRLKKVLFNKLKKELEEKMEKKAKANNRDDKKLADTWSGKPPADTGSMVSGEDIMATFDTQADEDVIF